MSGKHDRGRSLPRGEAWGVLCALALLLLAPAVMAATGAGAPPTTEPGPVEYRSAFGASSRVVVLMWPALMSSVKVSSRSSTPR